jgi:phosphopantetheine adenylyltransferase
MARLVVSRFPNVSVGAFEGLTVPYVRRIGARVIALIVSKLEAADARGSP